MPRRRGRGRGAAAASVQRTAAAAATTKNANSTEWFAEAFGAPVAVNQPHSRQRSLNGVTSNSAAGKEVSSSVVEPIAEVGLEGGGRIETAVGTHAGRGSSESSAFSKSASARVQSPVDEAAIAVETDEVNDMGIGQSEEDEDDDAGEESVDLDPDLERAYFERGLFETELSQPPLKEWTVDQVGTLTTHAVHGRAAFLTGGIRLPQFDFFCFSLRQQVAAFVRRLAHFEPKYDACWEKIAQFVELKSMNGALMCAVDRKYLHEEMVASGASLKLAGFARAGIGLHCLECSAQLN